MAMPSVVNEYNQVVPSAQPVRSASLRQTDIRHPPADDGMIPDASIRPTGPPPSVSNASYPSNSIPPTSGTDITRPGVPVSSSAGPVMTAEQHRSLRDSFDLPAPPTPPGTSVVPLSLSGDRLPSPPTMITPPPDSDGHFSIPQYLPPPELVSSSALTDPKAADQLASWHKTDHSNLPSAVVDNGSDSSSLVTSQKTDEPPLVRDTRSDLLAAIREGNYFYLLLEPVKTDNPAAVNCIDLATSNADKVF